MAENKGSGNETTRRGFLAAEGAGATMDEQTYCRITRFLGELGPHLLELSNSAQYRREPGRAAAALLGIRALTTEALNDLERQAPPDRPSTPA